MQRSRLGLFIILVWLGLRTGLGWAGVQISDITVGNGKGYVAITDCQPTSGCLEVGHMVYTDRTYTYAQIPAKLRHHPFIQTANNDKRQTKNPWLTFQVDRDVEVWVAYDARPAQIPSWLDSWAKDGTILSTTDTSFDLYSKTFPTGLVALGPNAGIGLSMYLVVIKESVGVDVTPPSAPQGVAAEVLP